MGGGPPPGGSSGGPPPLAGGGPGPGAIPGIPGLTPPPLALVDGPVRRRSEFVIMFVWREPGADIKTPAEVLAGTPASSSGSSTGVASPMGR